MGRWISSGLTASLLLVLSPTPGMTKDWKIGYVDLQSILFTSDRGKQAKQALSGEYEERKETLKKSYDDLSKLEEDIQSQASLLSEEARRKKEEEYWEKRKEFSVQTEKHEVELRRKDVELTQKILREVQDIIRDLAKKKGYTFVIEKNEGAVLYAEDGEDLTTDVLKAYDGKIKDEGKEKKK